MDIQLINKSKVKVVISPIEMELYQIQFESINQKNIYTKELFSDILAKIKEEFSLDLSEEKLFIEAYSSEEKGCILYIKVIKNKIANLKVENQVLACKINDKNQLSQLCKALENKFNQYILTSQIYKEKDDFFTEECYLLLEILENQVNKKALLSFLCEFCEIIIDDEIVISYIKEHFDCEIEDNAVKINLS